AGAIGVAAAQPFRVRALDREAADPAAERVLDRQRVGDVVARGAHLGAYVERAVHPLVLRLIQLLPGDRVAEHRAGVAVVAGRRVARQHRADAFGEGEGVRRQAVGTGADRVAEVALAGIGDGQDVDRAGQHDLVARLPA